MNAGDENPRKLTPEEERKVNRAQFILYVVMIIFIVLPFALAWALGIIGTK